MNLRLTILKASGRSWKSRRASMSCQPIKKGRNMRMLGRGLTFALLRMHGGARWMKVRAGVGYSD